MQWKSCARACRTKRPPDDHFPCPDATSAHSILMPTDPTSLTSQERELAERLARLGPHAEPSPAMDARILAAARDAATATPTRGRPRWPTLIGLAASLLLAVGLAWRLRPLPERPSPPPSAARSEARAAAQADAGATAPAATLPAAITDQKPATDASANQAPQPEAANAAPATDAQRVDDAMSDRMAPRARDATPAMKTDDAPDAPAETQSPAAFGDVAAPAPPAPPVAPTMQSESTPVVADEAARAAGASSDEPELDVPPATADAPEVREAWLQRIQALVDAGDIEGARASLHAFVARYPAYTLPENLRALDR